MTDVSVVIVTYNSAHHLPRCLGALRSQGFDSLEVIVVDNDSKDSSASLAAGLMPEANVVRNGDNLGFATATNQGIRAASGRFVLLLNPDALVQPGCISQLVGHMERNDDVGIVGCMLLNEDGSLQPSIGTFPNLTNQIGQALMLHRLIPGVTAFREVDDRPQSYEQSHDVDWAYGAVLLVRTAAIEQVGMLDEAFFLFSEEEDWCLRMRESGWRVTYTPEARAIHVGRAGATRPEVYRLLLMSKLQFVRKHYGAGHEALLRLVLLVGHAVRLPLWLALSEMRPARADAEARLKACRAGLRALVSEKGVRA